MLVDEPVIVRLSSEGAPSEFLWRGRSYRVVRPPEPWIGRESWWQQRHGAAFGTRRFREREMWRVDAVPLDRRTVPLRSVSAAPRPTGAESAPMPEPEPERSFDLARLRDGSWMLDRYEEPGLGGDFRADGDERGRIPA